MRQRSDTGRDHFGWAHRTINTRSPAIFLGLALYFSLPLTVLAAESGERPAQGQESAGAVNAEPKFPITNFLVDGNTLLNKAAIDQLLNGYIGVERRFADVESARRALEAMYLGAGYSTVRVILPEQEVSAGTILLRVQEMRLGNVELLTAHHHDLDNVRASLPGLVDGTVPNTNALAESLRLANENPSKQTHLLFKPDPDHGRVDALLRLEDERPWKAFVTSDNTGTAETGRTRLGVGYQHANLLNRDHVGTLQYITSLEKPENVSIFGFGYRLPLYDLADAIDFYGGYSDVSSGTVANLFNVSGKGSIFGGRYTHYFAKTSAFEHKLAFGLDYRAYRNDVLNSGVQQGHDVTVHPYNLTWNTLWKGERTQASGYLTWIENIPGGDKGGDADFAAARAGAKADYHLFRLGGSVSHQFGGDWQLRLALDAQYTDQALVSGEQFGVGGQDSVRGFAERASNGDQGQRYGIEVYTPDLGGKTGIHDARLRLMTFIEGGRVSRNKAQPGEVRDESLASAGLGMRFGIGKAFSLRLDYGHVIDGAAKTEAGQGKWHGSLAYIF